MTDSLEASMRRMAITDNYVDEIVTGIVEADVVVILNCFVSAQEGLSNVIDDLHANALGEDWAAKELRCRFFERFPDESSLYEFMVAAVRRHVSASYLVDVMPYIDEYIEFAFHLAAKREPRRHEDMSTKTLGHEDEDMMP